MNSIYPSLLFPLIHPVISPSLSLSLHLLFVLSFLHADQQFDSMNLVIYWLDRLDNFVVPKNFSLARIESNILPTGELELQLQFVTLLSLSTFSAYFNYFYCLFGLFSLSSFTSLFTSLFTSFFTSFFALVNRLRDFNRHKTTKCLLKI